jgi:hypothetical protein
MLQTMQLQQAIPRRSAADTIDELREVRRGCML